MSGFAPESVPELRSDVRFRLVGGEAVVVRQEAAEVLVLNEVGARVLDLVGRRRPVAEIIAALCAEFEVAPELAAAEVTAFLGEIAAAGLIAEPPPDEGGGR